MYPTQAKNGLNGPPSTSTRNRRRLLVGVGFLIGCAVTTVSAEENKKQTYCARTRYDTVIDSHRRRMRLNMELDSWAVSSPNACGFFRGMGWPHLTRGGSTAADEMCVKICRR
jgi:hypothetical protein